MYSLAISKNATQSSDLKDDCASPPRQWMTNGDPGHLLVRNFLGGGNLIWDRPFPLRKLSLSIGSVATIRSAPANFPMLSLPYLRTKGRWLHPKPRKTLLARVGLFVNLSLQGTVYECMMTLGNIRQYSLDISDEYAFHV